MEGHVLLDGTCYLRQELLIKAGTTDLPLRKVTLWETNLDGVQVAGKVMGSPVLLGNSIWKHSATAPAGVSIRHTQPGGLVLSGVAVSRLRC